MSPFKTFIAGCRRTDGREDHKLLTYAVETGIIARCRSDIASPTLLIGMKGVGKSSAFKFLTSTETEDFTVGAFSPQSSTLLNVPDLQPGLLRQRFYKNILVAMLALVDAELKDEKVSNPSGFRQVVDKLKSSLSSLRRLKGFSAFGFGATFDLSAEEQDILDSVKDQDIVEQIIIAAKSSPIRFFIDDPEQALPVGDHGKRALIGLILAANEINVNFDGLVSVTIMLKSHVYQRVSGNEEMVNIYPDNIVHFSWTEQELYSALEKRATESGGTIVDFFSEGRDFVVNEIIPHLRNGPRDMFVWIGMAASFSENESITSESIEAARDKIGDFSLEQAATAYHEDGIDLIAGLKRIFSGAQKLSVAQILERIQDLRVNDDVFIAAVESLQASTANELFQRLIETGALQAMTETRTLNPYHAEFWRFASKPETLLHPHPLIKIS